MKRCIVPLLIAVLFVFSLTGCGILNRTTIPVERATFQINNNLYGCGATLGQLVQDGVIEREEYFDTMIPVNAYDTISTSNKSYGMKLTVMNKTGSPAPYNDAEIIEIAVSNEYGNQANDISIFGLTLNDTIEDFKSLLGEPSMKIERDFSQASGAVYYWERISIADTNQTCEVQVITMENKLHLIKLSFK